MKSAMMAGAVGRSHGFLVWSLRCAVAVLVAIGVAAALGRGIFIGDLGARAAPFRERVFRTFNATDPLPAKQALAAARADRQFGTQPVATLLHVVTGGVFLALAPFQFSGRIRSRYIGWHRWCGRVLVPVAVVTAIAGLYFGLLMPLAGVGEGAAVAVFGGSFLAALARAVAAIRKRKIALHREYMIRAFAIGVGIASVRIVVLTLDVLLTPRGFSPEWIFAVSLWVGWAATLAAAESWIRYSRRRVEASPGSATA